MPNFVIIRINCLPTRKLRKKPAFCGEFGDYEFYEAMMDIARKLCSDTVFIKGPEKFEFIHRMFPRPKFVELQDVPAFKNLNNCVSERCEMRHGKHCARRKVYELRHAVLQQECQ